MHLKLNKNSIKIQKVNDWMEAKSVWLDFCSYIFCFIRPTLFKIFRRKGNMAKLITGGLGFLGTYLAHSLLAKGEEVVLFDVITRSPLIQDIKNRVKIVQGDLSSWAEVLEVVKQNKIDGIYHTGALLSASAEEKPITAYQVNAGGTFNILEAARLFNVEASHIYKYHCELWSGSP